MSKKILIVEDNSDMRRAMKEVIRLAGYEPAEAENGKIARELISIYNPDLIISDFQMPYFDGLELLKWVKANKPTPFILVTAFGHILETQEAFAAGADDFFTKPFKASDILASVRKILFPEKKEEQLKENLDLVYCRIPIEDFVSHEQVRVNIHIRLSEKKYVRVAHKGDVVPMDRVDNYKTKGVNYLYAQKDDFAQLVGFNIKIAQSITPRAGFSFEKKANFLRYTTETLMEDIAVNGIDRESFENAQSCMKSFMSLITESFTMCELLNALNGHANWLYAHSLGVSVYSIMIGKKMGWNSSITFFKLGIAGLFHDIGQKEISPEILEKTRPELSQLERKMYETHPSRGQEILQSLREIPNEILQVVGDHHETNLGQGYPQRLTKEKIHPLAKIIAVADWFCYESLKSPFTPGCDAQTAISRISQNQISNFDKQALMALTSLCRQCSA